MVYIINYLKAAHHISLCFNPSTSAGPVLLQCGLLRKLEQAVCCYRSEYFQVKKRVDHFLHIMSYSLGFQIAVTSCTFNEYIAMSMILQEVLPLMELIMEMKEFKFDIVNMQSYVYCMDFEDNSGALELA